MNEYDSLTGLYTREAFCRHAEERICADPGTTYNIVLSDFENFKHFNERYGTEMGDLLLIRTGELLSHAGEGTLCGRYSADCFVSMSPELPPEALAYLQSFQLPEQAKDELPVSSISVKFGVCTNVVPGTPISVYCDRAHTAAKSIKHRYGRNVAVYSELLGERIHRELMIEESMVQALETGAFSVVYQPKLSLATGRCCGAEALVRWTHPVLGPLSPGEFIPLFERNGFISALDHYVWDRVCLDLSARRAEGLPVVPISANASRLDLASPALTDEILSIVDRYGIDHSLFHLELTETCCADDPVKAAQQLKRLREAGFCIELDDFGAGYTSLALLSDLRFDRIKLDMSLLRKDDPASPHSVLSFAVRLAGLLGIPIIQEGVETEAQLQRMRELGCDYIQGYLYSRPLSAEDFDRFLTEHL